MKSFTPIIEAVGVDRLLHIVESMVKRRADLDSDAQRTLDEAVLEFVGSNPLALATLMLDKGLPDTHPGEIEAILRRAHERATDLGRVRVEEHAMAAGYFDLFAKPKAKEPEFLTRSQQAGLERMLALAKLHFEGGTRHGVQLRTWPLLVGPSGVGKSNLARRLASELGGLPVTKLSYGEWLVSGARTDMTTLQRLRVALEKHDRQIIFIDELDKVHATSDPWSRALLTELFGVIDRQLGVVEGSRTAWSNELLTKFRERVFIIGAGTWQDLWRGSSGVVGFGGRTQPADVTDRIRRANVIPIELLNRFNSDWIVLEPYTEQDFAEIAEGLKLPPGVLDPIAAAESGYNFRAVEMALTAHALRQMAGEF
ncbi:AAA family ATPase [Oleiharenicola lentus]|uniref:AAA family ATPase n=1 Tax=Oleiharenicola lentus TaxID=2508720 RepID=A0A4Q1C543_9BACT|nr:AAA family ATPase [Oleiharenicola lentus]RXK53501.1 AAA family ATPase [Oleiharenicola lentus]